MNIKKETAYLALRNIFVELADYAPAKASSEVKQVVNKALDIVEDSPVAQQSIEAKITVLMAAADLIPEDEGYMSLQAQRELEMAYDMALRALKEAV